MSAYLVGPVADRIQADTAGHTHTGPDPVTAQGPQWSEIQSGIGTEYGGLSNLFSGEGIAHIVDTAVTVPTDSIRGRLGGLVPRLGSVVGAGPTVTPDSAKPTNDSVNDPGIVQATTPGQVASNVANVPGGYSSAAAGGVTAYVAGVWGSIRKGLGI